MIKIVRRFRKRSKISKRRNKNYTKRLFNPDSGVIVEVNKNTEFIKETQPKLKEVDEVVSWKGNVTKYLWVSIFVL